MSTRTVTAPGLAIELPDAPVSEPATRILAPRLRLLVALAGTAVAFASSIGSVTDQFRYSAPAGELVVVLAVVPLLLDLVVRRHSGLWNGRLGHGDLFVAAALVLGALVLALQQPSADLNGVRVSRPDLLALPVLLMGLCVLMLGMRVLVVAAAPLLYGLVIWPYPLSALEAVATRPLTEVTYQVSAHLIAWTRQGAPVAGAGHLLEVGGVGVPTFEISVAPACAGLTGIVAYLLIGLAAQTLLRGTAAARLGWLAAGLVAVWVANVLRVVLIAFVGNLAGRDLAIGVLHPVIGLVLDGGVAAGMMLLLDRFDLAWRRPEPEPEPVYPPPGGGTVAIRALAVAGVAALFVLVGVNPVAGGASAATVVPRRATELSDIGRLGGDARFVARQDWTRTYFGDDSDWNRFRFAGEGGVTVWLDSLLVADDDVLRVHSTTECYDFYDATIASRATVRLAASVSANAYRVRQPTGDTWSVLTWQWPVRSGERVRYERITLLASRPGDDADVARLLRASADRVVQQRLAY